MVNVHHHVRHVGHHLVGRHVHHHVHHNIVSRPSKTNPDAICVETETPSPRRPGGNQYGVPSPGYGVLGLGTGGLIGAGVLGGTLGAGVLGAAGFAIANLLSPGIAFSGGGSFASNNTGTTGNTFFPPGIESSGSGSFAWNTTGSTGSAWNSSTQPIGVPEPSSMSILVIGVLLFVVLRKMLRFSGRRNVPDTAAQSTGREGEEAFLVDAENHGMGRWIDIEADALLKFVGKFGVVGRSG
jgi:hypothetical protein